MALPDEGLRLCGQGDANMGAGSAGKGGPCWRRSTEDKGSAGRATPTWAPAAREKAELVGVARRRIKALPAGRRQHGLRQREKGQALLACPDEGLRLCGQGDANMGAGSAGKGGPCWRGSTENKGFAGRATPTWAPATRERAGLVGVGAGKGGPCWRGPTEDKGFAGRATPTWVPVISHRRRDGFFAPLERKGRSRRT